MGYGPYIFPKIEKIWCPYEPLYFGKRRISQIWPKDNIIVYFMNFAKRRLSQIYGTFQGLLLRFKVN